MYVLLGAVGRELCSPVPGASTPLWQPLFISSVGLPSPPPKSLLAWEEGGGSLFILMSRASVRLMGSAYSTSPQRSLAFALSFWEVVCIRYDVWVCVYSMYVYTHIYIIISHMYIESMNESKRERIWYIYIYLEREREREKENLCLEQGLATLDVRVGSASASRHGQGWPYQQGWPCDLGWGLWVRWC